MTVKELYIKHNIKENSDVDFALGFILHKKRTELLFCDIKKSEEIKFLKIYKKLCKGWPLDLILKQSNFYGRKFYENKHVLKPRMDTEIVCEQALHHINEKMKVLDLCCGSGIIGITLAKEKKCSVMFSDISTNALKVCRKNVKAHNINAKIIKSNLFEKITDKFDLIISNPPYIKSKEIDKLENNVKKFDPHIALDGGADGLNFYRRIIKDAPDFLNDSGILVFEIGHDQAKQISKIMEKDFKISIKKDYNNNDRVIIGEKLWKDQIK